MLVIFHFQSVAFRGRARRKLLTQEHIETGRLNSNANYEIRDTEHASKHNNFSDHDFDYNHQIFQVYTCAPDSLTLNLNV